MLKRMGIGSEYMNVDEEQLEVVMEFVGAEDLNLVEWRLGQLRTQRGERAKLHEVDSVRESARICINKKRETVDKCHGEPHMCLRQL